MSSDDFVDWSAFEDQMRDVVAGEVTNVQLLDSAELLNRFRDCTEELKNLGEMLRPSTERGRDIHSMRAALRVELARRNLM